MSPPVSLEVRPERRGDVPAVQALHAAAFGRAVEPDLLARLRDDPAWLPRLSLVAELDGALAGHVCCTRAQIAGRPVALGLGPLGVLPAHQGRGVGTVLVHAVVAAADALGEGVVVLLGDPAFYGRAAFVPARELEIDAPEASWGPHFQARRLAGWSADVHRGAFTYAAPFADV